MRINCIWSRSGARLRTCRVFTNFGCWHATMVFYRAQMATMKMWKLYNSMLKDKVSND
jgi:hypothetical protein